MGYTIMELLHWTLDLTINPKKSKKNHLYLCTILHNYGTSSLDIGPDDQPKKIKKKKKKKKKKKIKIKSPLSMHHTTQLWNFFIGHWTGRSTQKNQKKNQNKITFIYAPYYTIMELLHWTLDLTINQKQSKKKSKKKSK